VVERLLSGQVIALVTDAGTPGISDPGFLLVREAVRNGIPVETLPGATAFVPALVDSALPCDRFVFLGFLPHKKGRQTAIRLLAEEKRTMVIYESPYRLVKLLDELIAVLGEERQVSVSREISKLHAETVRGTLREVHDHFAAKEVKGEIVVVLSAESDTAVSEEEKDFWCLLSFNHLESQHVKERCRNCASLGSQVSLIWLGTRLLFVGKLATLACRG
jgi:16S rRNA (cytidine1402-2'-O)-methyltransferase